MMRTFLSVSPIRSLAAVIAYATSFSQALAAGAGIFDGGGVSQSDLRNGDIGFDDIPRMILAATNFFLWFAGTIAVVVVIYGAFRLSTGSLESDKDTAKKIITAALIGFVLAVSSWGIIKIIMTNL